MWRKWVRNRRADVETRDRWGERPTQGRGTETGKIGPKSPIQEEQENKMGNKRKSR